MLLLTCFILLVLVFVLIDFSKKRRLISLPSLSFIVPCYNSAETIKNAILSIYRSYEFAKIDMIVIDDNSKDNTLNILRILNKKYPFRLITNSRNLGKTNSINKYSSLVKNEIFFVVDSDMEINGSAIKDILSRFQSNSNVGAVSCPYKIKEKSIFAKMQEMEYNMMSLILISCNHFSAMSLWGGCLAVKKSIFKQVGKFSKNMLTEDVDLAFKITKAGYKVEHSRVGVITHAPLDFIKFLRQKGRWISGGTQCYIKHIGVWIKHPIQVIFLVFYSLMALMFVMFVIRSLIDLNNLLDSYQAILQTSSLLSNLEMVGFIGLFDILRNFLVGISFSFYSALYVVPMIKTRKDLSKLFLVFPYSLFYWPMISLFSIYWISRAFVSMFFLNNKVRAW